LMSGEGLHRLVIGADIDEDSLRALGPEVKNSGGEGLSGAEIVDGNIVVLSDDIVSLRASLNGWVRLIQVAKETSES